VVGVIGRRAAVATWIAGDGDPVVDGEGFVERVEPFTCALSTAGVGRTVLLRVGLLVGASVFAQFFPVGLVVGPAIVGFA
jgi:hypothetical protein